MAKFCTNCGSPMEEDKKFCTECGTSFLDTAAAPAAPQPPVQPAQPVQTAPPPRQQVRQAPPQPAYAPQPTYGEAPPAPGSKYEPITAGGYIGILLLMCIPLVGLVLAVIWALGGCKKINKRNLARAFLVLTVIGLVLSLIVGIAVRSLFGKVVDVLEQETGITFSQDKDSKQQGSLLGGLTGLLGGDKQTSSGNEDLEALGQLGQLLEGLEGITGQDQGSQGLKDLLGTVEDINKEAEGKADGWPKSLRKYPGGTATSTASYRTEISGTTAEDMMAWIEDLKSDGFVYQDFYDFGMSEEDMLSVNGWWATDGELYLSLSYSEGTVIVDHMTELPDMSSLFGE